MGFLKDVLAVIVAEQIYPSRKEKVIENQNREILKRQNLILDSLGLETTPYKPKTDYMDKGISVFTIFCKIIIILVGTLIIAIMIALKVM